MKRQRHGSVGSVKGRLCAALSALEPETRMGCVVTAAWSEGQERREPLPKPTAVGEGCQAGTGAEKSTCVCPGLACREPGTPLSFAARQNPAGSPLSRAESGVRSAGSESGGQMENILQS